ncbi:MAG: B12-binding domain-containing radical SAM protein [Dehalococcoidia bacterium]|jgi:radical SAM superfamily enzyme YgiQ (UPF0313 family)
MRVLLVYPQYPDTFWSFKHALKFVSKKAAFPPLGLLTIAAMLPWEWDKKVIDLNVTNLSDKDIEWADYVFISAMAVQKDSVKNVIKRCQKLGTKIVAGGPLFTTGYEEFGEVDHFVLNEAEITLPLFLEDLQNGQAKHIYTSDEWADVKETPIPSWELIDVKKYSSMSLQYSRGCPFDCEFCDIVVLNGHTPRTKGADQLLKELDEFYNRGWRSSVFIVDDNFIGNKRKLKAEILPAIIEWMKKRKKPFSLFTEASINLADDEELVQLMVKANFNMVFIGIETTNEESLAECSKLQNRNRDLVAAVKKLQNHGLQVQGGFILGFDNDPASIFENMISFIQKSGIVTAMVGLLNAPRGTKLYRRLNKEKRLLSDFTGDNTDCTMNFIPKMEYKNLINGYKKVIDTIYSPKQYYERVKTFLKEYRPIGDKVVSPQFEHVKAFVKSVWFLGIIGKGRQYYWRLLAWTLARRPRSFSMSVILAIYGFHFRKVVDKYIMTLARDNGSTA